MPSRVNAPGDLLFGLLALQTGLIDRAALVRAFREWADIGGRPIAEFLVEQGALDLDQRVSLEGLAAQHLRKHGDDPAASLGSIGVGPSTRRTLDEIGHPDLVDSLATVGVAPPVDDPFGAPGRSIGTSTSGGQRFRILRPHARGGLGEVFIALDAELNREVALKEILARHADDQLSRGRFLVEAEITGGLQHPGIVPVYGLGHHEDGRPYYAMRFIKGDNLKQAIERFHADGSLKIDPGARSLALRKLLRRFVDVCNAIEYAHSRGVLHRDIKPGNVIVGRHGETLVVDWGLAKPLGRADPGSDPGSGSEPAEPSLTPKSSADSFETIPGSALGTPAYMSPEQAAGDIDRLGPRSDVYSLGATLYSVLTGRPPFEGRDVDEILRRVEQGAFPAPRTLAPSVDPALEAVCLRAMATNPAGRYRSPRAMAEDVERWSADEPVAAWREPLARRARRWAKRHRTAVTASTVAAMVALLGLSGVLAVQSRANLRLKKTNDLLIEANQSTEAANTGLRAANARELAANDRVQARFDLAQEAIQTYQAAVNEDLILNDPHFHGLRNKLLRSAADFYGKLAGLLEGQADRRSRVALSRTYHELGELTSSIGAATEAIPVLRKALALRRDLAGGPDTDDAPRLDLVKSLLAIGDLVRSTGDLASATSTYDEARDLSQRLSESAHASDQAREYLGECLSRIGYLLVDRNRTGEALVEFTRSLGIRERLAEDRPGDLRRRRQLAASCHNLGNQLSNMGKPAEAMGRYRQAFEIRRDLARSDPADETLRADLASTHHCIGILLRETDRFEEALAEQGAAIEIRRKLAAGGCSSRFWRFPCTLGMTGLFPNFGGGLMSRMIEVRTGLEAILVEQALAMARELEMVSDAAPDGQVLALSEITAIRAGRELTRLALQATLQRQSAPAEQNGHRAGPVPAGAVASSRTRLPRRS